jgi:uncharacterized membrane protein
MILIPLLIIVGYYIIKENGGFANDQKNIPIDKLKERYVNDEISEEEYLKKLNILKDK